MKKTFIKKGVFACVALLAGVFSSFAQTITTGAVSPNPVCAGSSISVAFTKTGTFPANTVYTVQLSNSAGNFPASPIELGTGTASPVSVTIPSVTTSETHYKVRVISKTPAVTGTGSGEFTINAMPDAPVVEDISYAQGETAAALTATGTNKKWYTAATGGTGSATAPIPSTADIGTKSYYVTQTVGTCESERAEIKVTITACTPPDAPEVADISYCIGSKAVALDAEGTALKWYTAATGGTGSATAPIPSTTTKGSTSYYVTQTVKSCESARAKIVVTVNQTNAPVVEDVTYCQNEKASALTATGTALKWYAAESGGTASTTAPVPVTTATGSKSYFVTQTLNGCESDRAEIVVTVRTPSAAPTLSAAESLINLCQNSDAKALVASKAVSPKWYTASTGGTALSAAPVPETETLGSTLYYVSQTVTGSCEGPRAKVEVVIKETPVAPTVADTNYCVGQKPVALAVKAGNAYKWYTGTTDLTGSSTAPVPVTTAAATVSYYVTQANTYGTLVCESPRAKLDVVTNATPATIGIITDSLCQERADKTYTFGAKAAQGNSLRWYAAATGGTPSAATPTVNLKTAGTTTYFVSQLSAKGCESVRSSQKLVVKALPALPGIDKPTIEYCQFAAAGPLTATALPNATLNWYGTAATGGTASSSAPVPATQTGGTTSFYVGQTLLGCVGDRAKIDVKINTTPKPQTTTSLAYCQNEEAPILDATGTVLKWYRDATGSDWQGYPFTPFTEKVEDYSFYVTQTGANGCESPKEEIKIHIRALPSATISGNGSIDLGGTATITLKFTGDGPWIYALSNGVTDTTELATVQVSVKPTKTTTFFVTEISNECGKGVPIGSAVVTVRVPTISSGNPSVSEACAGKTFIVPFQQSGDFPAENKFKVQIATVNSDAQYKSIPSTSTANQVTATFPDTTAAGSYYVRVVSEGTDPDFTVKGSVSQIRITANPLPVATLSGNQTILAGENADLTATITGTGPWTITLTGGTKDTTLTAATTPFNFEIKPAATTLYTIKTVTNGCGTGKGAGSARVQVDPILGIEPPSSADWVKVYPTVVTQQCLVEITGTISQKQPSVQVVDLNGRTRSSTAIKQKVTEVNFSALPSGLYLLRVQNGDLNTVQRVLKP